MIYLGRKRKIKTYCLIMLGLFILFNCRLKAQQKIIEDNSLESKVLKTDIINGNKIIENKDLKDEFNGSKKLPFIKFEPYLYNPFINPLNNLDLLIPDKKGDLQIQSGVKVSVKLFEWN